MLMNSRFIVIYLILLGFLGLVAFFYISRTTNLVYASVDDSAFEEKVKAVIAKNPETIVHSVMKWQQSEAQKEQGRINQSAKAVYNKILADTSLNRMGSGPIMVVEFFDYSCGYCKAMGPIKQKFSDQATFIIIDTPVLGETSGYLAEAVGAMSQLSQSNFKDIHLEVLRDRTAGSIADAQRLMESLCIKYGVDRAKFAAAMQSRELNAKIAHGMGYANEIGIQATPAYIINGDLYMGALSEAKFKAILAKYNAADQNSGVQ